MNFRIVSLGRDYPGKIEDFAEARNSFIEQLGEDEWILFLDDDAEAPEMLLEKLRRFQPPKSARYYSIRVVNLTDGLYNPAYNPFFWRILVSNKVRYFGRLHESIKGSPSGLIDIPVIHNHISGQTYQDLPIWKRNKTRPLWNFWLGGKKVKDLLTRGHYDPRVW